MGGGRDGTFEDCRQFQRRRFDCFEAARPTVEFQTQTGFVQINECFPPHPTQISMNLAAVESQGGQNCPNVWFPLLSAPGI